MPSKFWEGLVGAGGSEGLRSRWHPWAGGGAVRGTSRICRELGGKQDPWEGWGAGGMGSMGGSENWGGRQGPLWGLVGSKWV